MPTVSVIFDTHELTNELKKLQQNGINVPLSIISEGLITAIDEEIQSEGRGRWDVFMMTTFDIHPRRMGGKLLQDTGVLASMQSSEGVDWVKVKSPADYSGFHVTGAYQKNIFRKLAPHRLPKRDFLLIDLESVLEEAAQAIADEVAS
jgi:phage gpG-like protein